MNVVIPDQALPSLSSTSAREAVHVDVGNCAFVREETGVYFAPDGVRSGALEASAIVRVLDRSESWLEVESIRHEDLHQCHQSDGHLVSERGWIQERTLFELSIIATSSLTELPLELEEAGFVVRDDMVQAYGHSAVLFAPPEDGSFSVWRTGDSNTPFVFHAPAWDMGAGELVLIGPEALRALSPQEMHARYNIYSVYEEGFILHTDHLCLDIYVLLPLDQLLETGHWPTRFPILGARYYPDPANHDETPIYETADDTIQPALFFVEPGRGLASDLQTEVHIPAGTAFRLMSLHLPLDDNSSSLIEIELIDDSQTIILDDSHLSFTNLTALCAG